MKLQRMKNKQYTITVPSVLVRALRWKKFDKLTWKLNGKSLCLIKNEK